MVKTKAGEGGDGKFWSEIFCEGLTDNVNLIKKNTLMGQGVKIRKENRGNNRCKSPGVGACLMSLMNSLKVG